MKKLLAAVAGVVVLVVVAFGAAVLWPVPLPVPPAPDGPLLFQDVTVVDAAAGTLSEHRNVLIVDGRIESVGEAGAVDTVDAVVVDGSGKFLIPGLWDMHVHLTMKASAHFHLPLFVAHGVTGVRDMADCRDPGDLLRACIEDKRSWNEAVGRGELVGPRVLQVGSFIVHGPPRRSDELPPYFAPETEEEARELVRHAKGRGYDFLKVYNSLPREAYFALLEEAARRSIDVVGHRPVAVSAFEAVEAGQRSIEHARLFLLECYPGAEALRSEGRRYDTTDMRAMVEEHDENGCQELFAAMAATETWFVPTHLTRRMDAFADDPEFREDDRLRYLHRRQRQSWAEDADGMVSRDPSPEGRRAYMDFYELGLSLTGAAHRAGVPVLAGTDANDTYAFPGSGLHDELQELVRAGLTPAEALTAATMSPARFLGLTDDYGSIEEGKIADVVLLDENPFEDIRNTRSIVAVVLTGRLYTREHLDALLRHVESSVSSPALNAKLVWDVLRNELR